MTKKTILSSIFAIALFAVAGMGINKSVNNNANLSNLALINVEALAQGEGGGTTDCFPPYDVTCRTDWQNGIRYLGHKPIIV
ncbi:NVEALA domain-containing protein [Proteiniphilum propionicum]|jgi:hypothetical protein|uniref:NVEALA domain-containing protein n=1 Tax=Proteiniphilum propionicum TaxID=2829812 RepID=UPI001EEC3A49|nr:MULTISPECIES: NVEALA domain-containing protein [Proteiniphilum]MDD3968187.1 NVEALA domain-containing protein [Proteiniphilum sp.]MDD4800392.1 NVEALA domain-containing protein [Proteiniphilum sp.]ULB33796.1 hypothetical protein KDN43_12470 [Proteiniphilum propionicum]